MAFQSNSQRNERPSNESWKAQGFLNLYLPTAEGGRVKIGAIPLKESNKREAKLLASLTESDERKAQIEQLIAQRLIVEFRTAEQKPGSDFDLGAPEGTGDPQS